ncbi:origin recognition complex subunit 2 [Rhodofomes roseus]|uniref:Origin recognition complex subunit 2 n=1 Tax=Rhodofomes roseus TaxID=34475 RepID=A0ABQ8KV73_9APHY|nr:origin recognition complex subunit 2 [Rhodofomes roseus]KAH9842972.1 origin recognition complex subunit 2 [Rhodofomes roseus]
MKRARSSSSLADYASSTPGTSDVDGAFDSEDDNEPQSSPSRASSRLDAYTDDRDDDAPFGESTPGLIARTAFDAYFALHSRPARTSAAVFSQLVPALDAPAYARALAGSKALTSPHLLESTRLWTDERLRAGFFVQWADELREGFSLLFYGYGSKRAVLNAFARTLTKPRNVAGKKERGGHVVIANGYLPGFALKDLLNSVEAIPALQELDAQQTAAGGGADAQVQRIYDYFSSADGDERLYLVIHNIDGAGLRGSKVQAAIARLARAPRIHVVASIDNVQAMGRWSLSELFARKAAPSSPAPQEDTSSKRKGKGKARAVDDQIEGTQTSYDVPRRGFAWLWHDLTTLAPYDAELASADPSSITGASSGGRRGHGATAAAGGPKLVSETAARHVLASVTQKARRLFVLLGSKQLELMASAAGSAGPGAGEAGTAGQDAAYDYERLFGAAREEFIATSDTALRALLAEFRDHGLVVSAVAPVGAGGSGGGEALWIPMRREALTKVVDELKKEGA